MHGMGHLLEIIHGLLQAKTGSLMLYFLYVVASLKTSLEFFLSFHVGLLVLDWFIGTFLLLMMFANTFYCQLLLMSNIGCLELLLLL
jgi:hypothetical protein